MKIHWHIPAYMDFGERLEDAEFANQAELLALPRIRELMETEDLFQRWEVTQSRFGEDEFLLLIDKQEKQWVIATIPRGHGLDFPVWRPKPSGVTFRVTHHEFREDTVVEIYVGGKFRATLTASDSGDAVRLISTHFSGEPTRNDRGIPAFPAYEFRFRRD